MYKWYKYVPTHSTYTVCFFKPSECSLVSVGVCDDGCTLHQLYSVKAVSELIVKFLIFIRFYIRP